MNGIRRLLRTKIGGRRFRRLVVILGPFFWLAGVILGWLNADYILFVGSILLGLFASWRLARMIRRSLHRRRVRTRRTSGLCPRCGYDLRGPRSTTCPESGCWLGYRPHKAGDRIAS